MIRMNDQAHVRRHPLRAMSSRICLGVAVAAMLLASAPASAGNIIHELKREGRFTTLLAAVEAANLTEVLAKCTSCTLFAPNNRAFARLPEPTVAALLKPGNRKKLAAILAYHVVGTPIPASAVPTKPTLVQTLNASEAKIQAVREAGKVRINGVRVLEADIRANGSIIHEVRNVLWPGELH
jgi:uncharacterized surface protein with fasciclin (FAS1) repeats